MLSAPRIRLARASDAATVSSILREAATWLADRDTPMWRDDELRPNRIAADVASGLFALAEQDDVAVGTVRFQLADEEFWPDVPADESVFVHRLAVRRRAAGGVVSSALLGWAADRGAALGRRFLRLDCEASRARLRTVYEQFGFRFHSERQVGPYRVARYELPLPRTGAVS